MNALLHQLKKRRQALKLKQSDMWMRIGMSRQQYQRLESKGNPRLDTLELVAKGLNSELVLIPREHYGAVRRLLENNGESHPHELGNPIADDPWQGLLGEDV